MNKKILSTIFISLFLIITVFAVNGNTVYAANITIGDIAYNENDITNLRTFLNQESALAGITNGKALNSVFDASNPATWTGVTWTEGNVKCIKTISWDSKSLAGTLDLSGATSMTSLVCSNNKLTTLNVNGNTAMTILSCFSNQLTKLDLRTNKKLIAVNCSFNKLSDIDVSSNTALTNLCCYSNDLSKLDVSKNTALTYLDCNTNKLTKLAVSTNIKLNKLFCYANQINELDLSNNTLLTLLDCHSNKLSQLNVDASTKLTFLNCNSNQLTELNISKNTKIASFNCSNNKLIKIKLAFSNNFINLVSHGNGYVELFIDSSTTFATAVPFNKGTYSCWIARGYIISTSRKYYLTTGLTYNLEANFTQNVIFNSQGGSEIAPITANYNSTITAPKVPIYEGYIFYGWYKEADCINKWDFAANKITTETTLYAKWELKNEKDITINGNIYNGNDYTKLKTFLNQDSETKGTTNGKQLNKAYDENDPSTWKGVTWTESPVKRIESILWNFKSLAGKLDLSGATSLTSLECYWNSLTYLNVSDNIGLTKLDCSINKLSALNIDANTNLTDLDCHSNQLNELDVIKNTRLKSLDCDSNQLIKLNLNANLTSLYCSSNKLTELDVSKNTGLITLSCYSNKLSRLNIDANSNLTSLNCDSNLLTDLNVSKNLGLILLSCDSNQLIKLNLDVNTNLTSLYCSSNKLTELDISKNTKINYLNCANNNFIKINATLSNMSISLISNGNGFIDITKNGSVVYVKAIPLSGSLFANWVDLVNGIEVSTSFKYILNRDICNLAANFTQNVIFNSQGGSEIAPITANYNSTITAPTIPLKDGYRFDGWYKEADCINEWDFEKSVVKEITILYAKWKIDNAVKVYKITFNAGQDSTDVAITYAIQDSTITAPNIPVKEGYNFNGWYKEADCINEWDFSTDIVNKETVLYAKWMPRKVVVLDNITYDENDYTNLKTFLNQDSVTKGTTNGKQLNKAYEENNPATWTGVTWTDGAAKRIKTISCRYKNLNGRLDLSGATELTRLDCSGNSITELITTEDAKLTYIDGSNNRLSRIEISTNTNLTYLDCSENQLTTLDLSSNKKLIELYCGNNELISLDVSENVELTYLECSSNELTNIDTSKNIKLFSLNCSFNKLTELDIRKNIHLAGIECYGCNLTKLKSELESDYFYKSLSIIANGNGYLYISNHPVSGEILIEAIPMQGNSFANWTDSVNNSIVSVNDTYRDLKPYFSYNLQANFSQNVMFNSQGGSEVAAKIVKYNSVVEEPIIPIYAGYIFDGWYKENDYINKWNFATDVVTSETILYAKWVAREVMYTVTFNVNGGSAVSNISNVIYGDTIATPATPTKDGYDFKGWFKDSNYKNVWDFTNDIVKSDLTLYAKWIANTKTYSVKFNVDGSTVSEKSNIKYGDTITAPVAPTKNGFKFKGWYKDSALLDDWDFTTDLVKANMTLYANWAAEEIFYTVTFVDGDNTYSLISNITSGSTVKAPTTPAKENYAFIGWYKEDNDNKSWDFIRDEVTANTILYARWLVATDVTIDGITYNGNNYAKLKVFLNQESAVAGKTNGQMINTAYDENNPQTWTGVSWCIGYFDDEDVKYIKEISWASKSLAGKLDISGAKYLEKLNCSSNQLVQLDIGKAEYIEELNCSSNQLTMLDISGVFYLNSLDCSYNHINELDATGSYNLNCSSNDMTVLYLNNEVYYLKCDGNKFTKIDMDYYSLTLNSSGNGYIEMTYTYSDHASIVAVPNSGYSFVNWTDTRKGNQVSSSATIFISAYDLEWNNKQYTANFTQKVIFNSQGGSEVYTTTVNYNSTIEAPNPPTYEGYTFKGWYKEADCIKAWDFDKDVVKTNITLYAKWDAVDFVEEEATLNEDSKNVNLLQTPVAAYKVEFNLDIDNTYLVLNNVTSGSAITAPTIPVKEGYTFLGWYKDENCTEPWNFAADVVIADIKIYAKWLLI